MEDFRIRFEKGLKKENSGLITCMPDMSNAIDNIQKGIVYCVMGQPKSFKTKWVDTFFILHPYLRNDPALLDYTYYSWEVTRINKVADWISFFFWEDYKIKYTPSHILSRGTKTIKDHHRTLVDTILEKRIIPLIGDYDAKGKKIKNGIIDFIEERDNPTGVAMYLKNKAENNGTIIYEDYTTKDDFGKTITKKRAVSYVDNNPNKYRIVIIDHVRKAKFERGYKMKENIDKLSEYCVDARNLYGYSFVNVIHSNRSISDNERTGAQNGRFLRPQTDDVKDSGNLLEDCNILIGLFNPYNYSNIQSHFDYNLNKFEVNKKGKYRSIHVLANRDGDAPLDFFMTVDGGNNQFREIPNPKSKEFDTFMVDFNSYERIDYGEV